jgi:hypothetical protein
MAFKELSGNHSVNKIDMVESLNRQLAARDLKKNRPSG